MKIRTRVQDLCHDSGQVGVFFVKIAARVLDLWLGKPTVKRYMLILDVMPFRS